MSEADARYVLIGGFAVIAHGAARFTKDVDLPVDDTPDNIRRIKRGLSVLADNAAANVADTDVGDHVSSAPPTRSSPESVIRQQR